MPHTDVIFYQESDGTVPVLDWLNDLRQTQKKVFAKCYLRIVRLGEEGFELRRPEADFLRDGIYELRIRERNTNYRLLYFFHGKNIAILAHALTKEDAVPDRDILRALERKQRFEKEPDPHTYREEDEKIT